MIQTKCLQFSWIIKNITLDKWIKLCPPLGPHPRVQACSTNFLHTDILLTYWYSMISISVLLRSRLQFKVVKVQSRHGPPEFLATRQPLVRQANCFSVLSLASPLSKPYKYTERPQHGTECHGLPSCHQHSWAAVVTWFGVSPPKSLVFLPAPMHPSPGWCRVGSVLKTAR